MAGNRSKSEATVRLMSMGLTPGWIQEEEMAAFYSMSVNAFRNWQREDQTAPQPRWFGNCKRYRVPDGKDGMEPSASLPSSNDPIMAAINAIDSSQVR